MAKSEKEMGILRDHLAKHQLKLTRQRELILDAFLKQEHITAEEMYHQLAKKDPHLGLATLYRTLNLFCEAGLAQARHIGTQTQYDNISHKGHHDHLICTGCGKIVVKNSPPIYIVFRRKIRAAPSLIKRGEDCEARPFSVLSFLSFPRRHESP